MKKVQETNRASSGSTLRRLQSAGWIALGCWAAIVVTIMLNLVGMSFVGVQANVVRTASMSPSLPVDTLTFTRGVDTAGIQAGDVITFVNHQDALVMHRVTEVVDHVGVKRFRTKGDANRSTDPQLVHERDVVGGLVLSIPKVGAFVQLLHGPTGVLWLLVFQAPLLAWAWRGRGPSGAGRDEGFVVDLCPQWLTA